MNKELTTKQIVNLGNKLLAAEAKASAWADHREGLHVGIDATAECVACRTGVNPMPFMGTAADPVTIESARTWLTKTNRERALLTVILRADLAAFESGDL